METDHVARTSVTVAAPRDEVWRALIDPEAIKEYMAGADVVSDWREGSPIVWKGEWEGKPFEDKGVIKQFLPGKRLQFSHYSPSTGQPDLPENYHNVTIDLTDLGAETRLYLSQDGNRSEEARLHSEKNWAGMLEGLKTLVENETKSGGHDRRAASGTTGSRSAPS